MCFHEQAGVPNRLEAIGRLPAGIVSKGFQVQLLAENKDTNPGLLTWHRHWNDPYQVVNTNDTEQVRENRARGWFNQFVDGTFYQHANKINFISWWNEYYANSQSPEEKALWWKQERTAARIWKTEYRTDSRLSHILLTICAAAVGNDIPWQSAETAVLYDAIPDYHGYDFWRAGNRDPGSWQYYAGRWATMDGDFRNRGYAVRWLFGEGGPYSSPVEGWLAPNVCGGDVSKYVAAVKWWIDQCKQTVAYQEGRVLGPPTLFTTGGGSQWNKFETGQPEMNAIADMVKQNWRVVTPPPPDPDPPTGENLLRNADFEEGWFDQPTGQVPNEWQFEYYTGQSPYDPASYVKPETRVILKAQLPPGEWIQFGLSGERAVKAFKGSAPWHGSYIQNLSQPLSKNGKATIKFFADLVLSYGPKVYARYDPDNPAGQIRVNGGDWHLVIPGEINTFDFNLPAGTGSLKIEWRFNYPLANNGIFFDDPILTEVDMPPQTDPCVPREVYSRVYVVLPQSATAAQFAAVAQQYHGQKRTIGFSYDDAGHGPGLSSRTAILLGIAESQKQTFIDWYNLHYPGTIVQFGVLPSGPF